MRSLLQDLRFAIRQMARTPGFSLTAILSLALGIGATVSVFSVIYSAVLNAWPYAGFERVCEIHTIDKAGHEGGPRLYWAPGTPAAAGTCSRRRNRHEQVEPRHHWKRCSGRPGSRLLYRKCFSIFRHADDSRSLLPALGRTRPAGTSTGGGPELQLLASALQQRFQHCRQEYPARPQGLHHPGSAATPIYLDGWRCLSPAQHVAGSGQNL